jgi:hypothetical protein
MFLPFFIQLRKNQPKLFYLFGLFFILQVFFVLIKWEVTPFFLYGMYSEKAIPSATFTENSVWLNGKKLDMNLLSGEERLLIEETTEHYLHTKGNNDIDIVKTRVEQRYGLLTNSFIYPFLKHRIYNTAADVRGYEKWLKEKCSSIINEKVDTITLKKNTYEINKQLTKLKQINSETVATF